MIIHYRSQISTPPLPRRRFALVAWPGPSSIAVAPLACRLREKDPTEAWIMINGKKCWLIWCWSCWKLLDKQKLADGFKDGSALFLRSECWDAMCLKHFDCIWLPYFCHLLFTYPASEKSCWLKQSCHIRKWFPVSSISCHRHADLQRLREYESFAGC